MALDTKTQPTAGRQGLPPAAVLLTHRVADFDAWKKVFDRGEQDRRDAGILGHHINRSANDPNQITLYLAIQDVDRATAFAASPDLQREMQEAGVIEAPEMQWMTPVRESLVWDRTLPAFMLTHRVADFDQWLEGYDAAAGIQRSKGIIGHAANRSTDDPSLAIVYHQAESFDTLRAFLEDADLRAAMSAAGVTSEPEVTFCTGGWAKRYE
jgi:hypothetical protein